MILSKLKNMYCTFNGRIGRKTYWLCFVLPSVCMSIFIEIIADMYGDDVARLCIIPLVPFMVMLLSGWIKRQHDLDRSGWWVLLSLVPVVNFFYSVVYLGCFKGNSDSNKYGLPEGGINAKA